SAAKHEIVRTRARKLELRLLDQEEVLDRLRQRAEPVLGRSLQLTQLVLALGQREPAMQIDLQRLGGDVLHRDVGIDACVDAHRTRGDAALAGELRYRFGEHLYVELEAEGRDMSRLLVAQQVARAANLEVAHRDRETGTE